MTIDSIASSGAAGSAGRGATVADSIATLARVAATATASPASSSNPVQRSGALPTGEELAKAVSDLNKSSLANAQGLEFSVDTDSKRTVVKVIDQATGDVLRQMPTQEALEIAKSLDKYQQGMLIKQTA